MMAGGTPPVAGADAAGADAAGADAAGADADDDAAAGALVVAAGALDAPAVDVDFFDEQPAARTVSPTTAKVVMRRGADIPYLPFRFG
jgi:hypothetical protein